MTVINLHEFREHAARPTLVLVGLHTPAGDDQASAVNPDVLARCRSLLAQAREFGIPVAHVRRVTPPKSITETVTYPRWLPDFEPLRSDMIFDVSQPSCYLNPEFSQVMEYGRGNFAIAGLFGETICLSTAIDAHHRRHRFVYLSDASECQIQDTIPPALFHESVARIIAQYGDVMSSASWSRALAQRWALS